MAHELFSVGDSQTDIFGGAYARPSRTWTYRLQKLLEIRGVAVKARALGVAGNTSTQSLARLHGVARFAKAPHGDPATEPPAVAVIAIGVNDPGNSINQAASQANISAHIKALKHGAFGSWTARGASRGIDPLGPCSVADVASLPANGKLGQRYVVMSDTATSSGVAPDATMLALGLQAANVGTSGGSAQTVWEWRNSRAGEVGWGRVVNAANAAPTWCKRIVVVSTNYLQYTSGGDTPSTPYATYASVRVAQKAAVDAHNVAVDAAPSVIYTDLYGYQRARIIAGTDINPTSDTSLAPTTAWSAAASWLVADADQHHNEYGHLLVAQAIIDGGPNGTAFPAAWVTALAA